MITHVTRCRLCDGPLELIYAFTPTPPGDAYRTKAQLKEPEPCYPLDLMRCDTCGAVQLADTVDPSAIYLQYQYTTGISKLESHFHAYATQAVERLQPAKGSRVIDVGSNDGTLLEAFRGLGCTVLGIDPADDIARSATSRGLPTYSGFLTRKLAQEIQSCEGQAVIVTANHVMANVADLHDFIEAVKLLLANGGTFIFETGYWPLIQQHRLIDTIEHEHIHYFAIGPLIRFFHAHDLTITYAETNATKGGSIRCYVQRTPARFDLSVLNLLAQESRGTSLTEWAAGLSSLKNKLKATIVRKPKRERWVGYGAAVGSTLLLHYFGFGDVLSELWDDNPGKIGRFSPGYHLPVCAPQEGHASKVVILAYRYADRIIRQHPNYRGQFLIPLPDVRVA